MKKANGKRLGLAALGALALAWAALFLSGHGVLVWSAEREGEVATTLECRYFTGAGLVTKRYVKTPVRMLGAMVCPRLTDLD